MKSNKTLIVLTACIVSLASLQPVQAGDRGWATTGKVLTGVVAGSILLNALDCAASPPATVYYAPAPVAYAPAAAVVYAQAPQPVVCAQPVVYAPAPAIYYSRPAANYYGRPMVYPYPVAIRYGHGGARYYRHR